MSGLFNYIAKNLKQLRKKYYIDALNHEERAAFLIQIPKTERGFVSLFDQKEYMIAERHLTVDAFYKEAKNLGATSVDRLILTDVSNP